MIELLILAGLGYLILRPTEKKPAPLTIPQVVQPGGPPPLQLPGSPAPGATLPGFPFQVDPTAQHVADLLQRCQAGDQQACSELEQMGAVTTV